MKHSPPPRKMHQNIVCFKIDVAYLLHGLRTTTSQIENATGSQVYSTTVYVKLLGIFVIFVIVYMFWWMKRNCIKTMNKI